MRRNWTSVRRAAGAALGKLMAPLRDLGRRGVAAGRLASISLEQRAQDFVHVLRRVARGKRAAACASPRASAARLLLQRLGIDRVDLGQRDDLGLFGKAGAIGFELVAHGLVGLAGMLAAGVDEMQQHAATLDMAEKAVAEAGAFMRAFDEAGNIGEHKFARRRSATTPSCGMQRREGIVRDLRLGGGDGGEKGGFAGIGQADEARIGDQLEPQTIACAPAPAWPGLTRRGAWLVAGLEMRIAEAAIAACSA